MIGDRYARQIQVIGAAGQARLRAAHVLVIGAGGLGCPVLTYLAGAGLGRITLLDPDRVEESNLHRQTLFRMADIGRDKVLAAREHLLALNPQVRLDTIAAALTPDNAAALINSADLIIDAADSFAVSFILSDICTAQGKWLISASAQGQSGYAGVFCGTGPGLRAVFPDPPQGGNCATLGVLGPAVGTVGALAAQLAVTVIAAGPQSVAHRLTTVDLATLRFGGFSFADAPTAPAPAPFLGLSQLGAQDQLIELRSIEEAPLPFAPAARRIDPGQIAGAGLDPDRRVVLCCTSGLRAWRAASCLRDAGFARIGLIAITAS